MLGGGENLERQCKRLARHAAAIEHLRGWGLSAASISRFGLGLKAPYRPRSDEPATEDALSFPIVGADGRRLSRFAFLNLEGITSAPPHPVGWGIGSPLSYWSDVASPALPLLVAPDVRTAWLMAQAFDSDDMPCPVVLTRSHGRELPLEWLEASFWASWRSVAVLSTPGRNDVIGDEIARIAARPILRLDAPGGSNWPEALAQGISSADVRARLASAEEWRQAPEPASEPGARLEEGDFAFDPVNIANAFLDDQLFYPFLVEERIRQSASGRAGEREMLVAGYATRVLRSDGSILKVGTLPAPRGAPDGAKVFALSDGTRINGEPAVSRYATWSFPSIKRYVEARRTSKGSLHRPLALLASEIEAYLRACVWLPVADDYAIAVTYVLMSYVFPVFDALPLLLINGPKGTGKTELGQAIADLSCNGVVVGQGSAAGLVRLMHEARGLIVLDDLERIGASAGAGFSEIAQMLKLSYKRNSAIKPVADRAGSVATLDFFGPKCITNTLGSDDVLGSRMVTITTAGLPEDIDAGTLLGADGSRAASLRDELHSWGMARAVDVATQYREAGTSRGRRQEIEAPLRAIALLVGASFSNRLGAALGRPVGRSELQPAERLRRAIASCGANGAVTIQQLQLELALTDPEGEPISPETLGRLLSTGGYRGNGEVTRVRLNGVLCRVVGLEGPAAPALASSSSKVAPLDFCRAAKCAECRYAAVCFQTLPDLRSGKRPNGLKGKLPALQPVIS